MLTIRRGRADFACRRPRGLRAAFVATLQMRAMGRPIQPRHNGSVSDHTITAAIVGIIIYCFFEHDQAGRRLNVK